MRAGSGNVSKLRVIVSSGRDAHGSARAIEAMIEELLKPWRAAKRPGISRRHERAQQRLSCCRRYGFISSAIPLHVSDFVCSKSCALVDFSFV